MSPTVLPNAVFEIETHAVVSLTPLSSLRAAEKAAIALAMEENEKQGIRPVAVADHDPPAASARKIATASRAKPTKPKRAARAQDLYQARNSWAFAPSRTEYNPFGGFGTWFR
jgi:hypothetical protein